MAEAGIAGKWAAHPRAWSKNIERLLGRIVPCEWECAAAEAGEVHVVDVGWISDIAGANQHRGLVILEPPHAVTWVVSGVEPFPRPADRASRNDGRIGARIAHAILALIASRRDDNHAVSDSPVNGFLLNLG